MLKVGITGSMGAGKTTVCRIFESLGVPVFNADEESKQILSSDRLVLTQVHQLFGDEVFQNGIPDRKKIAEIVFNDTLKLRELNSILHPAVFTRFDWWVQEQGSHPYVIHEAALIFETGAEKFLNKVIVISAPEEVRIKRIMQRENVEAEDVRARMKNQLPQEMKEQKADFVIINDENHLLIPQVMNIHRLLTSREPDK